MEKERDDKKVNNKELNNKICQNETRESKEELIEKMNACVEFVEITVAKMKEYLRKLEFAD